MAASDPIVVIGGGLGGLASAIVLRARGYPVILFEHNQWLGGKAAELRLDGFRFDMGPTVLTVPSVLARIFEEAGRNAHEVLDLVRLNPQWRCFFEDGSVLDLVEDTGAMSRKIDEYAPGTGSGDGYRRLLELSRKLHDISQRFFFWRSVEGLADTMDLKASLNAATMRDVLNLRMGATVAGTIRRHVPDERVAQMLDHFVQYVGSSPFNSPAVLCAIAHMQADGGVWYPRGGTKQIPASLQELARAIGVEIHTGTGVNRIVVENGRAVAVQNDRGERIGANAVVSNMDAVRTYRDLIGGDIARRFERRRRYEPACSGIVFYLGLSRRYDHLLHHSFVFSRDAKEEFEAIYRRGEPAPDPTCYLAAPARSEPEVAPPGGEALYVLVHTPYLRRHHDWRRMLPEYRRVIYDKLARTAGMDDLEQRIVCQAVLTPQDIHDRYRVLNGAIYGLASHGRFFGAFKPGNRRDDVRGLYLAGGAAHPGPGMPMVLMSGWIAADTLDRDLRLGAPLASEAAE